MWQSPSFDEFYLKTTQIGHNGSVSGHWAYTPSTFRASLDKSGETRRVVIETTKCQSSLSGKDAILPMTVLQTGGGTS
jgi:hypothetical protein